MTKLIRDLGPLAIATAVAGAVVLWLLDANPGAGRWVLAALLFAHGWVHLMFVFPRPAAGESDRAAPSWPFDLQESWLVTRAGLGVAPVVAVGKVLMAVTFAGSMLAALATAGVLVRADLWAGLVVASALASILLLGLRGAPTLLIGIAIDVALVWLALAGPWSPVGA